MSWFGRSKELNKPSEEDLREARRQKLLEDRKARAEQRERKQKELQAIRSAQEEADKAVQDLLSLDPDILAGEDVSIAENEVEELLAEDLVDQPIIEVGAMADFESENGIDGDKADEKLGTIQCPFDKDDIEYWFSELEGQLEVINVRAQWTKRTALQRVLPLEIKAEVKSLLRLTKSNAGNDIYKRLKQELIDLFGKKQEDDYLRAKNRRLTGKPSQLGKALIDDICHGEKKLDGCCCAKIVWAMFREELPVVIRNHISEMTFSKDTYKQVFARADQVYASNQAPEPHPRPTVAAVKSESTSNPEVAAVNFRPRKNKKNNQNASQKKPQESGSSSPSSAPSSSSSSSNSSNPPTKPKGTRHPTAKGKDENLCRIHYQWGINGTYCAAPWKCPMKDIWRAPQ